MRALAEIRRELDEASEHRADLWEQLSEGFEPALSAEAARLTERIEELWTETRIAEAHMRYGDAAEIITRARAQDRLDREARRWQNAA